MQSVVKIKDGTITNESIVKLSQIRTRMDPKWPDVGLLQGTTSLDES